MPLARGGIDVDQRGVRGDPAVPGGGGCPPKRETGPWRAAAHAGAVGDRDTWLCVLSKRRPSWLTSVGATPPQTSATKRSDFHLAQPATECVSSQNSRGRNSVRNEGASGHRTRPTPHRRDLRNLKKMPFKKNLNFRRHMNRYQETRQDPGQFPSGAKRPFTGASRGPHVHSETVCTHTNAPETIASANSFLTPLHYLLAVSRSAFAGRRHCHVAEHRLA